MEEKILKMICELGGQASFIQLQKIPGFKGYKQFGIPEKRWIFWQGMSDEARYAIQKLIKDRVLVFEYTSFMTYIMGGVIPRYPLAQDDDDESEPRWVPVNIVKGMNFEKAVKRISSNLT